MPLMWVSRNFRDITCQEFYKSNTVKIIGNSVDLDASQHSKSLRLRKFYRSTHCFARELDIIVNKSYIFAGRSLDALSCTTFDRCAFPLARKLKFSFYVSYEQKMAWYSGQKERQQQSLGESTQPQLQLQNYDAAASAATIDANISAFVERIKEMTPKVREIEVVGGSAFVDQSPDTEHFVSLVARLFRLATRIAYKFDEDTKPLDLRVDTISNLVHIDIMADSIDPIAQLARQSAETLQSLCIKTRGRGDISGLIQSVHGDYVEYSQLRVLRLNHCSDFNDDGRPVFPGAAPFPYLRLLSIASSYPFADDVVFRRNAATLEYLDIRLERDMALLLMAYNVFTCTSHPRLQYVKTRIVGDIASHLLAASTSYSKLLLAIAPSAAVRSIEGISSSAEIVSALVQYSRLDSIQVLSLSDTQFDLWDAITLIESLPLLSDLHAMSPILGSFPADAIVDRLPVYVLSKYAPIGPRFRCWHAHYSRGANLGEVVACVLLLALICPNFDYCTPPKFLQKQFMGLIARAVSSEEYKQHAPRLLRLFFSREMQ
ncbi:hypothetical protein IW146_003704 [Coemansia sp. RSA 922]|nr:hypothetical protein GGI08_001719 [Coemansia sp. S2]KAJ2113647.1 hypothetical protein IW146_003704 [Coemansia sp. RSA 922]